MNLYLHDTADMFRFEIRGPLTADCASELEHAWITALSVLGAKEVVVDVTGIAAADATGIELLSRMRKSGVRLTALASPASPSVARLLGIPAASRSAATNFAARLSRFLARLSLKPTR